MYVGINPGHSIYGSDNGFINRKTLLRECDVVKKVGDTLEKHLLSFGIKISFNKQELSLVEIVNTVERDKKIDLFISLHCNSGDGIKRGTEIEVYNEKSESNVLANFIKNNIQNISPIANNTKITDGSDSYLLKQIIKIPAVIVYLGYIDNEDDEKLLRNKTEEYGIAISKGIIDYYKKVNRI